MKLMSSPASPFGRKARMTMAIKNLQDQVEIVKTDTSQADAAFFAMSPLGRIPALQLDNGEVIHDSHVICEYLDSIGTGPVLVPREGPARWRTLTLGSLADGLMEQALLQVYEGRYRPENMRVESWIKRLQDKIDRSLDQLEASPPQWQGHPDYGHLTLACALGYMDFRHGGRWRTNRPKMVAWLEAFAAAVPSFKDTAPPV